MSVPATGQLEAPATEALPAAPPDNGLTLLVIGEDPAGSFTVPEMLDTEGNRVRIRTARNLTEAERLLTDDVQCILLDLALPGPCKKAEDELDALHAVLRLAPAHAVLVLTAVEDGERAAEAVRVGAQDFLFRDELDGRLLSRAIRYAVERKRSDLAQRQLTESRLRAQENARLERGLLPTPLLQGSGLRFAARYRPGRSRALLGGDFYDTVRTPDGTVHAMIGDVCGHGPDEAALGVELRIAWRALTFAGLCGDQLLGTLQQVLENERADEEIFATLCTVDIAPDGRRAGVCLAGHPAPRAIRAGRAPRLLP
ncbi:MAG: fused response regulator/phosphatase, partial [Streptomyces sp.]|nr:fused response regulator/phosphatase [Streptomyces sp.]